MYAQYNNLCQFGLLSQAYQPISPSILIHFRWELYHEVPMITKALPIIKWTEAFQDFLNSVIGDRLIPLAYITCVDPQVPGNAPPLAVNQPHSTEHGSVEGELVARAAHTHVLYRDTNFVVYYHLEEATRGTPYAASIKPFQRGKDGRGHGSLN